MSSPRPIVGPAKHGPKKSSPSKHPKQVDPHKIVGIIVIYSFAADSLIRFLNWLIHSLIIELAASGWN